MSCPQGHAVPTPSTCVMCNMAVHKDPRYARRWFPGYEVPAGAPAPAPPALIGPEYQEPALVIGRPQMRVSYTVLGGLAQADRVLNCSVLPYGDEVLLAYRAGWLGSSVWLTTLDGDLKPRGPGRRLPLQGRAREYAQEDPRLFLHRGRVHVSFAGLGEAPGPPHRSVQQCCARLTPDLGVEDCWWWGYRWAGAVEKNWQPFSWEDELFFVYRMRPWTVLHAVDDRLYPFSTWDGTLPWAAGEPRGGAPPFRVGDEFWCWFHGMSPGNPSQYTAGVCAFEGRPPFRPTRCTRGPLLAPDAKDYAPGWSANVVYPAGALLFGDKWLVSAGYQDRECRLYTFRHEDVERRMHAV